MVRKESYEEKEVREGKSSTYRPLRRLSQLIRIRRVVVKGEFGLKGEELGSFKEGIEFGV